jgi:nitrite reductase/ring-hydroxylating ferredoxin subunit
MREYAIDLSELQAKKKARVVLGNIAILLVDVKGKPYAIADKCPHFGASLFHGEIDNGVVKCKAHGAEFDVVSGEIKHKPQILFLKMPAKSVKTYPTFVDAGKVYVELIY